MPKRNLDETLRSAVGVELHPTINSTTPALPGAKIDLQDYADQLQDGMTEPEIAVEPADAAFTNNVAKTVNNAEATLVNAMDFSTRGRTLVAHRTLHKVMSDLASNPDLGITETMISRWHTKVVRAMNRWGMTHNMSAPLDETLPPSLKKKSRYTNR